MSAKPKRPSWPPADEESVSEGREAPARRALHVREEGVKETVSTARRRVAVDAELRAEYGVRHDFAPAFLYVEQGPGMGQLLELRQGTLVLGRASTVDLRLRHPSISRQHVRVHRVGDRFYVEDLGSQNGTFVNKTRARGKVEIRPMDSIGLGTSVVRLRGPLKRSESSTHQGQPARLDTTALVARPGARTRTRTLPLALILGALGLALVAVLVIALSRARRSPAAAEIPQAVTESVDEALGDAPAPTPAPRAR